MVPQQDPKQPGSSARKPAKNPHRAASFSEAARAVVHKDRYDRRAGFSVDTAGAIARALERAYAQGFVDAQAPPTAPAPSKAAADAATAAKPVEWILIPPRPRDAFWTICLFTLGRDAAQIVDEAGHLRPVTTPNGKPGWQLVSRHGFEKPADVSRVLPARPADLDRRSGPGSRTRGSSRHPAGLARAQADPATHPRAVQPAPRSACHTPLPLRRASSRFRPRFERLAWLR